MTSKRIVLILALFIASCALVEGVALLSPVGLLIFTPIVFFGKVVDETGQLVPNAEVHISYVDHIMSGDTKVTQTTDSAGRFSCFGRGASIVVEDIIRDGYYPFNKSRQFQKTKTRVFGYTRVSEFDPHWNPKDPAVLVLKRIGKVESLTFVCRNVPLPTDGSQVALKLSTGKTVPGGDGSIVFEARILDQSHQVNTQTPYDWSFHISVPNGGLCPRIGDFNFEAPEKGYVPNDEIDMSASLAGGWRGSEKRQYFLKLPDGHYGRIAIEVSIEMHAVTLWSLLNPTRNSRNLEYGKDDPLTYP